jgi:hypothetical protein
MRSNNHNIIGAIILFSGYNNSTHINTTQGGARCGTVFLLRIQFGIQMFSSSMTTVFLDTGTDSLSS